MSTGSKENKSAYPSSNYFVFLPFSACLVTTSLLDLITTIILSPSVVINYLQCSEPFLHNLAIIVNLTKV